MAFLTPKTLNQLTVAQAQQVQQRFPKGDPEHYDYLIDPQTGDVFSRKLIPPDSTSSLMAPCLSVA
ncbi:MAG TPA: hypothetical protein V6D06_13165 [Trichocoleus sp.]